MESVKVKPQTEEDINNITSSQPTIKEKSIVTTTKKRKSRTVGFKDIAAILFELDRGQASKEVADTCNVSTPYVNRIKTFYGELQEADRVARNRSMEAVKKSTEDAFIVSVDRIQRSISTGDIYRASLKDKVWAIGVLYDKHRLATGQSTSNVKTLAMIVERMDQGRRYPKDTTTVQAEAVTITDAPATDTDPLI